MVAAFVIAVVGGSFVACGGDDANATGGDDAGLDGAFGVDGALDGAGDGSRADAGDGACVPRTCPASFECGDLDDGCGHVVACGKPCTGGKVCDSVSHACVAPSASCKSQNAQCGYIKDSCGVPFDCGACPTGQVCDGHTHQCVPATTVDAGSGHCVPGQLTCTGPSGEALCGTISDGCGGTKSCGCANGQQCGGGGTPGICGVPPECKNPGACGTFGNACGSGQVSCGGCPTGQTCGSNHQCGACTPNASPCGNATCGTVGDGCGGSVKCGTCSGSTDVCHAGSCCTPLTCDEIALDAGADAGALGCTPVPDGCGGQLICTKCSNGQRCVNNQCATCPDCDGGVCDDKAQCCFPKTCADFPNAGCQPVNLGCGKYTVCKACAGGQTCLGDGTCCVPQGCNGRTGLVDDGCGHQVYCPAPR